MKQALLYLWKNYNHLLILSYYGVLALAYSTFNQITVPKYYMYSFLDDYIPFLKIFVIPYIAWYAYIVLSLVYFGLTSREDFIKLTLFMFIGMSICYTIYFLLPNGQNLRPLISDQDFLSRLILGIWGTDRPTNVAPSMHVLDSIAIHVVIANSKRLKNIKWVQITSLITATLCASATVFIKQHSIEDVFYAIILSYIIYHFLYRPKRNWRIVAEPEALPVSRLA